MITGTTSPGDEGPVWAKLLRRATDVVRFVGAVLQAVYYGRKDW
ncbi:MULTISPECIES: hypothetical protein [Streptomyces]|nr:hypothetical protein [Streptomyces musisoli]